ncbi:MAG: hypothetical protein IT287_00545 [Bdellovibrionaceae bacterium]|nr:hypothetical protein [Pseudobdellovibrionaceae bacterium]
MNKYLILALAATTAALTACSSSSDSGASTTAAGLAFQAATGSLESLSNLSPAPVSAMTLVELSPRATGLTAIWDTEVGFMDEREEPAVSTSIKEYMGIQFQEDAIRPNGSSINVFGRISNAASIICIVANTVSSATSAALVTSAPQTITFTTAVKNTMVNTCGFASEDLVNLPETATLTFSSAAPSTIFDLKISLDFGGDTQEMFTKWGASDGTIAFAGNEDNDNGRTRTVVIYNSTTGLLKAEYLSKSKGDSYCMTAHRLWKNETSGAARVFTVTDCGFDNATDTSGTNNFRYIVDGNTNDSNGTHLSLAMTFAGYSSGNGTYEACVQKSDGSSVDVSTVTSNEFTCSSTGGTGGRATAYAAAVVSDFNTKSTQVTPTWHLFSTAPDITWTSVDEMLTAVVE